MRLVIVSAICLIVLSLCLVIYKVAVLKYFLTEKPPHPLWRVRFQIQFEGKGGKARVGLLLPRDSLRQRIYDERTKGNGFRFSIKDIELGDNRRGYWERDKAKGRKMLGYEFSVKTKAGSIFKEGFPEDREEWLRSTKLILKKETLQNLAQGIAGSSKDEKEKAEALYQYVRDNIANSSNKKDRAGAYATLLEKEGSSAGKARLLCALLRASGIPSRIVGGLILEEGIGKDIHFWVEAYLRDGWVPFCPTNGYLREIPSNYLTLYRGDLPLIKKSGVKEFEYLITVERERRKHLKFISRLEKSGRMMENEWSLFSLPWPIQSVARMLLVVPLGALVVAIFRNVIGIHTFGTFTPILMALAFRESRLGWGLLFFFLVVAIGCLARALLERMKLLLVPRLSILVTLVITAMLILTLVGYHTGLGQVLSVALFPMVIMTMAIERFSITQMETGTRDALLISLGTIIVASTGYMVMSSELVQLTMFSFPELLLTVVGILILLGRYPGLRLTELWRFRDLSEG